MPTLHVNRIRLIATVVKILAMLSFKMLKYSAGLLLSTRPLAAPY